MNAKALTKPDSCWGLASYCSEAKGLPHTNKVHYNSEAKSYHWNLPKQGFLFAPSTGYQSPINRQRNRQHGFGFRISQAFASFLQREKTNSWHIRRREGNCRQNAPQADPAAASRWTLEQILEALVSPALANYKVQAQDVGKGTKTDYIYIYIYIHDQSGVQTVAVLQPGATHIAALRNRLINAERNTHTHTHTHTHTRTHTHTHDCCSSVQTSTQRSCPCY